MYNIYIFIFLSFAFFLSYSLQKPIIYNNNVKRKYVKSLHIKSKCNLSMDMEIKLYLRLVKYKNKYINNNIYNIYNEDKKLHDMLDSYSSLSGLSVNDIIKYCLENNIM
jgi:hypothetical protein